MADQVSVVEDKSGRKRFRERLRHALPGVYERVIAANTRRKDRRYHGLQSDLFANLDSISAKPFHIEVETINKCNSTCGFCPVNRFSDPRPTMRMDAALFSRIIDELAGWDFAGVLNLFSNNEPFLDRRIFDFAAQARSKLPDAFIQVISNGTALDVEKSLRILPHLSRLIINDYGNGIDLHDNIAAIRRHLDAERPELAAKTVIALRRLDEFKTNRAGSAPNRAPPTTIYTSRCAYPFFQMVIRPDGKVSLCCNDALGEMTIGDLASQSLPEAWASPERRMVQQAMLKGRDKIPLCAHCDNLSWAKPKRIAQSIKHGNFSA